MHYFYCPSCGAQYGSTTLSTRCSSCGQSTAQEVNFSFKPEPEEPEELFDP